MKIRYSHNNSGGGWWLTDKDWFALEKAGWTVEWVKDDPYMNGMRETGRWLLLLPRNSIVLTTLLLSGKTLLASTLRILAVSAAVRHIIFARNK